MPSVYLSVLRGALSPFFEWPGFPGLNIMCAELPAALTGQLPGHSCSYYREYLPAPVGFPLGSLQFDRSFDAVFALVRRRILVKMVALAAPGGHAVAPAFLAADRAPRGMHQIIFRAGCSSSAFTVRLLTVNRGNDPFLALLR